MSLLQKIADTELLPEQLCKAADEVARETGETVAVAAPAGSNAVLLYVIESRADIRFSAQVGHQVPIHATSTGRALLAQYSSRERASVLKKVKFEKYSRQSPLNAEQVEAEIKRAATRGWHENIGGHDADLTGVALPVGLRDRRLSVVVGGPTSRMRQKIPQIAAAIKRALKSHLPAQRAPEAD
jgi:DNA-binding IclR family transcriptional regulator